VPFFLLTTSPRLSSAREWFHRTRSVLADHVVEFFCPQFVSDLVIWTPLFSDRVAALSILSLWVICRMKFAFRYWQCLCLSIFSMWVILSHDVPCLTDYVGMFVYPQLVSNSSHEVNFSSLTMFAFVRPRTWTIQGATVNPSKRRTSMEI